VLEVMGRGCIGLAGKGYSLSNRVTTWIGRERKGLERTGEYWTGQDGHGYLTNIL
jgi:hypothetical protein